MSAKKSCILAVILITFLLSACHVVDVPARVKSIPLLGPVQLKLPKMPSRPLTAEQVQATTTAVIGKGIPPVSAEPKVVALADPAVYFLQSNTPAALQNFAHPDLGCNWMGVAGQVFDKNGSPVANLVVNVSGSFHGVPFSQVGITGSTIVYGPSSFEIKLGDQVVASDSPISVQLSDLSGNPVSPMFGFQTTTDCAKNLIVINFNQVDKITTLWFPILAKSN